MIDDERARWMRERPAAQVWLLDGVPPARDFDEVAVAAGLEPLGRAWVEVDPERAEGLLTGLLRTGLAYGDELMPEGRARWLASEFIRSCGTYGARYGTNTVGTPGENGASWTPATSHDVDAGVVLLGRAGSACYWVAEDV
ncbi:hypothetical protein DNL40_06590 [Xylanimonas oleitrophica]|uniref:Uncharacterized protein n=1 Tax=Xylanimonas oleitrophica TaxID=2607479 RepID=A0A2W5WZG5_9MICO|nr:hypothetical protein [Xylanimonas oleitrophica]PZR53786.1 hypothetical protein DNL40_06590 [Xylanimonas oleitrophica]